MPSKKAFAMLVSCLLFGASDGGCADCMEHEQNVLMQLANLQPDLDSNQDHLPFRRFGRLRRRFRGFRRYGGKTTTPAPAESTTRAPEGTTGASPTTTRATTTEASPASTSTEATTTNPVETTKSTGTSARSTTTEATASSTTTTTTTRVVCTDPDVGLRLDVSPPQSEFTIESPETSNCQCVGGTVLGSIPGWLTVVVRGVGDPKAVSSISITSPNATEVKVSPIIIGSNVLFAGTVLFNGFQGVGNWTIKLLDASGTLSSQTGTGVSLVFAFEACSQILPTPDCVGNAGGGAFYAAQNFSLVGTTLSTSPSLLQFDVGASSSCCVPAFDSSQFSSSQFNIRLQLGFTPGASGTVRAEGLSPSAIPFNLTGDINIASEVFARLTPGFVGSPAAGLWNLNTSTDGAPVVIDDARRPPELMVRVEAC